MPPPASRRAVGVVVATMAALVAAGGCVGDRPTLASEAEPTSTTADESTSTTLEPVTKVAQAKGTSIDIYDGPRIATASDEITADDATAAPDIPIVFLVKGERGDRLEVFLPTPPSGSTGWVRTADVTVSQVSFRVVVDLGDHRLRVFDDDEEVLDEPVAIGRTDRPDPGRYYIKELLQPSDEGGPYGAYAYGFAGYTTNLGDFAVGTGIVGIHGTDDEDDVGGDVATGCIGLENDVIERLVDDIGLPLGTPVQIIS